MLSFIISVIGLIVLISLIPTIWKVAKGLARIVLTILIFCAILLLLLRGLAFLSLAF